MNSEADTGEVADDKAVAVLYTVSNMHMRVLEHEFPQSDHSNIECYDIAFCNRKGKEKQVGVQDGRLDPSTVLRDARMDNRGPYKVKEFGHRDFFSLQKLSQELIRNCTTSDMGNCSMAKSKVP
jgi:hypothetical protein